MSPNGHPSPLAVAISPLTGRSYRATCDLPQDICVLDVPTSYADTVYKKFRKEVCAECWRYELGRSDFLTCRDHAEAGLLFCDNPCRDAWLAREGKETVDMLKTLEAARIRKAKGKAKEEETASVKSIDADSLDKAWQDVAMQCTRAKTLAKWRQIQLDDFEADLARYVLLALIHLQRELTANLASSHHSQPSEASSCSAFDFGGASWKDFAALQSGELLHISKFPELLDNWIRIYQVLKSRFAAPNSRTDAVAIIDLSDVITPQNVRTALGVDPSNSFGIWQVPVTEESEGLGFGIYPIPSFFNHHCSPNVRKERVGRRLRFVTTKEVHAGDELCISYGHVDDMGLAERRKHLQDGWFFLCQCRRCLDEDNQLKSGSSHVSAAGP